MKKNEDERKKIQKYVIKLFTDGFISGILRETEYAVTNPAQYARPSLSVLQAGFRGILHRRKSFGGQAATTNRPARRSPKGEVGDDKEKFFIFNLSLLILKRSLQITTAIPYMTGHVHIGNTMDHILADILVRYQRMR